MAQPTPFVPSFSFTDLSTDQPTVQQPGVQLDAQFDALALTTNEILDSLVAVQRDDFALKNGIVHLASLGSDVLASLLLIGAEVYTWTTATAYTPPSIVVDGDDTYLVAVAHVSGVLATDVAANLLVRIFDSGLSGNLASEDGGSMVGTTGGATVQDRFDELSGPDGATVIGSAAPGTGSATRTQQEINDETVFVTGKTGDLLTQLEAVADDHPAGVTARLPQGSYALAQPFVATGQRFNLRGDGEHVTSIVFDPVSTASALVMNSPDAGGMAQGSITGLGFTTNNDVAKTAIDLVNVANFHVDHVGILFPDGDDSTGIRTRGRQFTQLTSVSIAAGRPVVISPNATYPTIAADYLQIHNAELYCTAAGGSAVEVEDGAVLSNTVLRDVALVGGKNGYKFRQTAGGAVSTNLQFENTRVEQAYNAAVTGATKANPAVITFAAGHRFRAGQQVTFAGVGGMTQLNGNTYTVANPTATTLELSATNSTAYGTYTSGGTATIAGAWSFDIESTAAAIQSILFLNVRCDNMRNGIRIRNGQRITLINVDIDAVGAKVALDIEFTTDTVLTIIGGWNQTTGTVTLANARKSFGVDSNGASGGFGPMEVWVYDGADTYGALNVGVLTGRTFSLATDAVETLIDQTFTGYVTVTSSEGIGGEAFLRGALGTTSIANNPDSLLNPVKDNATTVNIYGEGGVFKMQSKYAATRLYNVAFRGSRVGA